MPAPDIVGLGSVAPATEMPSGARLVRQERLTMSQQLRELRGLLTNTLAQVLGTLIAAGILAVVAGGVFSIGVALWLGLGLLIALSFVSVALAARWAMKQVGFIRSAIDDLVASMTSESPPSSPDPSVEAEFETVPVIEQVTVDDLHIQILKVCLDVRPPVEEIYLHGDTEDSRFCAVKLHVSNMSNEAQPSIFLTVGSELRDSKYTYKSPTCRLPSMLPPGSSQITWIAWEVPTNFRPTVLRLRHAARPAAFSDVDVAGSG